MTPTDGAVIAAVIAAVPPTTMAYLAWSSARENAKKSAAIMEKADEIHVLTNDNLSKVTKSLEVANLKIDGLEKLVATFVKKRSRS